jgi:competence protein ComEA
MLLTSPTRGDPITLAEPADLRIHVAGEVSRPGVYELPPGSIIQDAIDAAGGFNSEASQSRVNLAATLEDGQQVFVPMISESAPPSASAVDSNEQIAINLATAPELERLPGIGPVLAQRIVEYREQNGPYLQLENLLEVEGIGPAKLDTLRDHVQVP